MSDHEVNDDGASPDKDIKAQNPGATTTGDIADDVDGDDPHTAEKLTKAGREGMDPDQGSD